MKITDIQVHPLQAPGRTLVIILVETDAGLTGVGEAGLQRRWHAVAGAVRHMREWLVGEDPFRIEHLWQRMWRGGFYSADRLIGSAISGIDIALWDIKGQALGVPVYELLGGRCRDRVDVFTQPGYLAPGAEPAERDLVRRITQDSTPSIVAELAMLRLKRGQKYFRIAPPPATADGYDTRASIRQLLAQLRAVRETVGDRMELMVDLHARFSLDEAIWFCHEVEPLELMVVEDPLRSEHPRGYRTLRRHARVPLAAGEQWASKWEFRAAIENEWIDYARMDVCIAGGLSEAKKIAALAETHMVQILPHNPLGPVCTAASLHLDLACNNAGPQEVLLPPHATLPDVFDCAFELKESALTIPTAPGIGVRFDREAAAKYPAEMTEPPHFHRPDGSFTNH